MVGYNGVCDTHCSRRRFPTWASRLYRSTRALYGQVLQALDQLELQVGGSPTAVVLLALYVTGLILLDVHQTQTRVTRFLPGRCHDALNRLLQVMPCSTRRLMALLVQWVKGQALGYLCLDDVIVEKTFARKLSWAGWCYSFAKKRQVYGLHIVVILWCSVDGRWRIPVAFRLWRPKRSCSPRGYRSKLQLAEMMLKELPSGQQNLATTQRESVSGVQPSVQDLALFVLYDMYKDWLHAGIITLSQLSYPNMH